MKKELNTKKTATVKKTGLVKPKATIKKTSVVKTKSTPKKEVVKINFSESDEKVFESMTNVDSEKKEVAKTKTPKIKVLKVKEPKVKKAKVLKVKKTPKIKVVKIKTPKIEKTKPIVGEKQQAGRPKKVAVIENTLTFPIFNDVPEMKTYCVASGLNLVDGYILATKLKKTDFLAWMEKNKASAKPIEEVDKNSIAKSNIDKAKAAFNGVVPSEFNPIETNTNEDAQNKKALLDYGNSFLLCINSSPLVQRGGVFPMNELQQLIASASKLYTYEIKTEGGISLLLKDTNGNEARVPTEGFLPM